MAGLEYSAEHYWLLGWYIFICRQTRIQKDVSSQAFWVASSTVRVTEVWTGRLCRLTWPALVDWQETPCLSWYTVKLNSTVYHFNGCGYWPGLPWTAKHRELPIVLKLLWEHSVIREWKPSLLHSFYLFWCVIMEPKVLKRFSWPFRAY